MPAKISPAQAAVDDLDPATPECWIARGRKPEHAAIIAAVWRSHPDLPSDAPLADRQARMKARSQAMRPVNDAISAETEANLQAKNFAFIEGKEREGEATDRDLAILRGRDEYGHNWHVAQRYADGWYAAHTGRAHHYPEAVPCRAPREVWQAAYDQGFLDGGGDRDDLFDVARRAYLAELRRSNMPSPCRAPIAGRPLPSTWLKPTDQPRPARWSRRLAIISDVDVYGGDPENMAWDYLHLIQARPGSEAATVLILTSTGFVDRSAYIFEPSAPRQVDDATAFDQIRQALAGSEFDDVLVALQGEDLALLDRVSSALPLCRTMERTRNTRLQFRAHLKTWLDRGVTEAETIAAGHIRWGKVIHGLSGKLGEFTVRHVGPAPAGGHLVRVEVGGEPARGYATASGLQLAPEIVVKSKARLRAEVTKALRAFAAATPLMSAARLEA